MYIFPVLPNPYVFPSEHFTKKRIKSRKILVYPAEGDGEGLVLLEGLTDEEELVECDGLMLADGVPETEGEGLPDADGDGELLGDGDTLLLGEDDDEGLMDDDCSGANKPSSFSACVALSESTGFLISALVANLKEPTTPLSS